MEPTVVFPPTTPFTLQVTSVFVLPVTVAAYCDDLPTMTLDGPLRTTVTVEPLPPGTCGGAARSTASPCETVGSATLVAVIVTFAACGMVTGAV
jgi:hypothetical protein